MDYPTVKVVFDRKHEATKQKTGLDCLMLGLFQPQDNLHAPNESFSLSMARKGASYYEKFLEALSC